MKRFNVFKSLAVLYVFSIIARGLVPSAAEGAVPQLINFQGILRDGSGNPVTDGSYSVTFTIYDAPSGGTAYWAETTSVITASGLFTVLLGSANPVPDSVFHDTLRYLGIQVGADPEMTPRQQLSSVGYGYVSSQWNQASFNRLYRLGGFVGIGTDNPVQTLHVSLNGTNTAILVEDPTARARFGLLSQFNNEFGFKSAAALQFGTISDNSFSDFSEKMRLTPSGNVGIGTSSPTAKLHIGGTAGVDGIKFPDGTLQTTAASGGGWTDDGAAVRLTTSADNVGIGTTAPAVPLHVSSSSVAEIGRFQSNTAQPYLSLWYGTFEGARIQTVNDVSDGGSLRLFTAAPPFGSVFERMRITSAGNVGIGTTSPQQLLHVASAANNTGIAVDAGTAGRARLGLLAGGVDNGELGFKNDLMIGTISDATLVMTSEKMRITNAGNVGIGTTSPGASNLLELASTTKGFVLPRMTKAERDAIASPVAGMMVYQTDNTPGLRVYNGTNWMRFTETAD